MIPHSGTTSGTSESSDILRLVLEFWQGEGKSGKVKHKSRGRKPTYLGASASATGAVDQRSAMGQTIDMINNGEYVMGLAQERIHARSRRKTNIRTGPKAAGKGSSKGKKSPKETKRSMGAGKGSGSKKERRQRSFGFF